MAPTRRKILFTAASAAIETLEFKPRDRTLDITLIRYIPALAGVNGIINAITSGALLCRWIGLGRYINAATCGVNSHAYT